MSENALTVHSDQQPGTSLSVDQVIERMHTVEDLMRRAMVAGVDYGQIPGTNSKPTLLKPGAEKLVVMFRLPVHVETVKTFHADGHLTVESKCTVADKEASSICSTRESKYAWRKAERKCPECGRASIIKGKAEYGGGWLCWKKKEGCGASFADDHPAIVSQETGRVINPDIADTYHTVIRMAEKRAFVAAARLATGTSALFDEEMPEAEREPVSEPATQPKSQPEQQEEKPTLVDQDTVNEIRSLLDLVELEEEKMVDWISRGKRMVEELLAAEGNKLLLFLQDEERRHTKDQQEFESWTEKHIPGGTPDLESLNRSLGSLSSLSSRAKGMAWKSIQDYARWVGWQFDNTSKKFTEHAA